MSDLKCQKCFRLPVACQARYGTTGKGQGLFGDLACSKCTSGLSCLSFGKYWKR